MTCSCWHVPVGWSSEGYEMWLRLSMALNMMNRHTEFHSEVLHQQWMISLCFKLFHGNFSVDQQLKWLSLLLFYLWYNGTVLSLMSQSCVLWCFQSFLLSGDRLRVDNFFFLGIVYPFCLNAVHCRLFECKTINSVVTLFWLFYVAVLLCSSLMIWLSVFFSV